METQEAKEEVAEIVEKEKRGRKVNPESITKDPKYFINYYHKHLSGKMRCTKCNKTISKHN